MAIMMAGRLEDSQGLRPVLQSVRKRAGGLACIWGALRPPALGIFDAQSRHAERITNSAEAVRALAGRLANRESAFVLFEATGHYDSHLRKLLDAAGIAYARASIPPAPAIPAFARTGFARAAGFWPRPMRSTPKCWQPWAMLWPPRQAPRRTLPAKALESFTKDATSSSPSAPVSAPASAINRASATACKPHRLARCRDRPHRHSDRHRHPGKPGHAQKRANATALAHSKAQR
jgi:hypothetical protein